MENSACPHDGQKEDRLQRLPADEWMCAVRYVCNGMSPPTKAEGRLTLAAAWGNVGGTMRHEGWGRRRRTDAVRSHLCDRLRVRLSVETEHRLVFAGAGGGGVGSDGCWVRDAVWG